ncbi:MAG: hypothetical protein Q3988_01165 [Gemella sp.]|nr:hypothetical protein [Gemella sp.]
MGIGLKFIITIFTFYIDKRITVPLLFPITYANLQGAIPGDGWLYQVRLVIEEHLGKSLDNATNKEIEQAILEISSRNGFENAVKTPVTIP